MLSLSLDMRVKSKGRELNWTVVSSSVVRFLLKFIRLIGFSEAH